ncbi:uncharacterized protein LOC106668116 [Cimex lectularius]|uniref:Uncharacterized protein n=1 Tax=Cimex lectularius TaxID=79782 RepID=A0A8I6RTD3_CIMLE|nr:uncharacterized protein LOC106668116 [Cimex lectularius]
MKRTGRDSQDTESDDPQSPVEVDLDLVKEEIFSDEEIEPLTTNGENLDLQVKQEYDTDAQEPLNAEDEKHGAYVSINAEIVKKAITAVNRLTDDCSIFGDFVASELRSLKSKKMKMKLQSRIQKAILKVAEEDEELHTAQENSIQ